MSTSPMRQDYELRLWASLNCVGQNWIKFDWIRETEEHLNDHERLRLFNRQILFSASHYPTSESSIIPRLQLLVWKKKTRISRVCVCVNKSRNPAPLLPPSALVTDIDDGTQRRCQRFSFKRTSRDSRVSAPEEALCTAEANMSA